MDDKSALLGSLKIEREPIGETPRRSRRWILVALLLGAAALVIGLFLRPAPAIEIQAATARPPATGAAVSVLDASGYVVARRRATVSSKVTGKVVELLIEEGSRVEEGQVLARIDDSNIRTQLDLARAQLEASRAQLTEVRVQLAEAARQLHRSSELAQRQLVSQSALDTAQAGVDGLRARLESTQRNVAVSQSAVAVQAQQLDDTVVRAPFAGVITVKNAQPGEMISPLSAGGDGTRTGIGTLVDMDSLEVEVDVNENFINRVQPGQPAETALNAYSDWKIPSSVIAVIPTADRSKATIKVRIRLDVRDPRVIPDMGARVRFLAAPSANPEKSARSAASVLVPAEALLREGDSASVYLVLGEIVERRAVQLGEQRDDMVEVRSGLAGGELLATSNLSALADGRRVTVAAK